MAPDNEQDIIYFDVDCAGGRSRLFGTKNFWIPQGNFSLVHIRDSHNSRYHSGLLSSRDQSFPIAIGRTSKASGLKRELVMAPDNEQDIIYFDVDCVGGKTWLSGTNSMWIPPRELQFLSLIHI